MKQVIGYEPILVRRKTLTGRIVERTGYKPIYKHIDRSEPEGNPITVDDVPPLDAEGHLWANTNPGMFKGKER